MTPSPISAFKGIRRYLTRFGIFLLFLVISLQGNSQAPQKIRYQGILRNSSNQLLTNTSVGMRCHILQGSPSGTTVYTETHSALTDSNALLRIELGTGSPVSGVFASINWASGPYFLKTELDPNGGTNYSGYSVQQLLSVPYALYAETSAIPPVPGPQGIPGTNGLDGEVIFRGGTPPSASFGDDGSFYLDTISYILYGPKNAGVWNNGFPLTGIPGAQGLTGAAGVNGTTLLHGNGAPVNGSGNDGDFYLDTIALLLYGPQTSGNWGSPFSLIGPQGIPGISGVNGNNGRTILNGPIDPAPTTGNHGDLYINTSTWMLFGPNASGSWINSRSIIGLQGLQGPQGPPGVNANTILHGNGTPSALTGNNGDFYLDTSAHKLFGPKTSGAWGTGVHLTGPQGIPGPQGQPGPATGGFTHYIGESFGGGIIFHVYRDTNGVEHGLVVSPVKDAAGSTWSNVQNAPVGPGARNYHQGYTNIAAILSQPGHTNSAALVCDNSTRGGFNDWYLPSTGELELLNASRFEVHRTCSQTGGDDLLFQQIGHEEYWSSTELYSIHNPAASSDMARTFNFNNGVRSGAFKNTSFPVRCIRAY